MSFLGAQNSIALGVQGIIAIDTGTGTIAVVTDPYWPYVSMLLHGDGTNAARNNTFLDGSTNNFTVTRNGNTTQGSFNPFTPVYPYSVATNGGSGYFDGTGDYLTVPDNAAFTLGTNAFTVECWIYPTTSGTIGYFAGQDDVSNVAPSIFLRKTSADIIQAVAYQTSANTISSISAITINAWSHIAYVRDAGGTLRLYINGVQNSSFALSGSIDDASGVFGVGSAGAFVSAGTFAGYISNFRLVNGTCLYPSGTTFTPPTAPLTAVTNTALLLGMSNGAIYDNAELNNLETVANAQISTSVFKYGTGSMKFNGTTDYLLISPANQAAFTFGSGDFTIEMWYQVSGNVGPGVLYSANTPASSLITPFIYVQFLQVFYSSDGGSTNSISGGTQSANVWHHLAVCRSGTSTKMFINGTQVGATYTDTRNYVTSSLMGLGANTGNLNQYFGGYIDDLRVTKGIARYTTTFTPPTAAFPNLGPTYPSGTATQRAIFGFGEVSGGGLTAITNIVSNTGVVAGDTTGVGTARGYLAASSYGGDKAIFGFGYIGAGTNTAITNLVSNAGVVASDTTGIGTARASPAAARYSTDKAIFGYGAPSGAGYYSLTNLVANTGVVATDTTGVGTARRYLAAASYSTDKAIFGYGSTGSDVSITNLVSNTGVVSLDTTGVGTARSGLAAANYGSTGQAIFGYGSGLSITNLVSNTGVVATDTTGVGTARGASLAAAGYGGDKAIFGFGQTGSAPFYCNITNLVSNAGVVSADQAALTGTIRTYLAAAGFSYS